MLEILDKLSDQVKRVENMCSGSVPALEGEYYTPPECQMRVNTQKYKCSSESTYILGQEPVPSMEGSVDQWLFQVEGALATLTEEAVRSAVIELVREAACELFRVHRPWRRNECHT